MTDIAKLYELLIDKLATGNLSELVTCASQYTKLHITVLDLSYRVLTSWPREMIGDPYWDAQQEFGYVPETNTKKIFENKYPDATFSGVTYIDWGDVVIPRCASSLCYKGRALGHLSVYHTNEAVSKAEVISITECISGVLKLYFLHDSAFSTELGTIMSALISKIFLGQRIDEQTYSEWARVSGKELRGPYLLAAVSKRDMHDSILEYLSTRLDKVYSRAAYAEVEGYGYFLFYGVCSHSQMQIITSQLDSMLNTYKLKCGVSSVFHELDGIQQFMYQSRQALKHAQAGETVSLYSDKRTNVMLSCVINEMDPINCIHDFFTILEEMDTKNGTQYYETLMVYLDNCCDSARAANALFIHRNTLLYRIRHIEETFGCSLEDPNLLRDLMLSSWVSKYRNEKAGL